MNNQIDREKVYAYFDRFHGHLQQSTNGWYVADCPICGSKGKFALNFNHLLGKCWKGCFNGFLLDVIMIYHRVSYFEARELIDQQEVVLRLPAAINRAAKNSKVKLPRGYHSILDGNGSLACRAREYLMGRNFDLNYLDRIGIGYCSEEDPDLRKNYLGYIIIPFKRDGSLIYFIGRDFIGNFQRYKNPSREIFSVGKSEVIFNEEALYLEPKIYVTEGWSCAATVGKRGISQQGATPSVIQRNMIIKSPVEEVVLVPDANFYAQGLTAARVLMQHKKVKVVNMDKFCEMGLGKDINEVGLENMLAEEARTPYMTQQFLYSQLKVYA
jgi:hypothetical protein